MATEALLPSRNTELGTKGEGLHVNGVSQKKRILNNETYQVDFSFFQVGAQKSHGVLNLLGVIFWRDFGKVSLNSSEG